MRNEREPQPVGDLVERFLKSAGFGARMDLARLAASWHEAVGPTIAAHSTPVALDGEVLTVRADGAVWASELKLLGARVATAASRFLDGRAVTEVRVRVGADGPGTRPREV